jgi:hypothetical protein
MKTSASETSAPEPSAMTSASATSVGLGNADANRGGEAESDDSSHQELTVHEILHFTFATRFLLRIVSI